MSIHMVHPAVKVDSFYQSLVKLLPEGRFWYLAGPMSGIAGFNYAEFDRVAERLRSLSYAIANPAEFDHETERKRIMESDGDHTKFDFSWADCLSRDVAIVAHPRCVGVIVIEGWESSKGAQMETFVADRLGKPVMALSEQPLSLVSINRDAALAVASASTLAERVEEYIALSPSTAKRIAEYVSNFPKPETREQCSDSPCYCTGACRRVQGGPKVG